MRSLMRAGLLALGCLAVAVASAAAADLQLKAPPRAAFAPVNCTLTSCSGFYGSIDLGAAGTGLQVANVGLNGGGVRLGGSLGYQLWNGNYFLGAEAGCQYDMAQNLSAIGGAFSNRVSCTELLDAGASLAGLFAFGQPTPAAANPAQGPIPINVIGNLSQALMSPFATLGAAQRWGVNGTETGMVTGLGARFLLSANNAAGVRYLHTFWNDPSIAPGVQLKSDDSVRVSFIHYFAP